MRRGFWIGSSWRQPPRSPILPRFILTWGHLWARSGLLLALSLFCSTTMTSARVEVTRNLRPPSWFYKFRFLRGSGTADIVHSTHFSFKISNERSAIVHTVGLSPLKLIHGISLRTPLKTSQSSLRLMSKSVTSFDVGLSIRHISQLLVYGSYY